MPPAENRLIERLPRGDRGRLLSVAEPVTLLGGEVLCERGAPTRHAHFPVDGVISPVTAVEGHRSLEVGMVGREGMLGAPLALGIGASPWRSLVQGPGNAWRVGAAPLRRALAASPALQRALQRYLFVQLAQLARRRPACASTRSDRAWRAGC